MKITILTLFPELFAPYITTSIIKKAVLQSYVVIECINIRDFTLDKHQRVDDTPFGGGAGLVMKAQPIMDAIDHVRQANSHVIYLTPVAPVYTQSKAKELSHYEHLILLCGHYEGIDERVLSMVDDVISIGDYILTGGEVAAMVVMDSIIRLIPGVISSQSIVSESFEEHLLEYPQYTRPEEVRGLRVPEVLISGHHANIEAYRQQQSLLKTMKYRPDLLKKAKLSEKDKKFIQKMVNDVEK
ncbi:MAG: tRNA (guanosine(37)-N1)-methyltransferase TrmD [Erysipelotrichia bacterium]|jgi:tRNA (guanine37-N1)-methyltransferase|nr:tRNA (guanosine(37)-N1)-methyltransferase TrmD [Erysipelotrichia bacterium]